MRVLYACARADSMMYMLCMCTLQTDTAASTAPAAPCAYTHADCACAHCISAHYLRAHGPILRCAHCGRTAAGAALYCIILYLYNYIILYNRGWPTTRRHRRVSPPGSTHTHTHARTHIYSRAHTHTHIFTRAHPHT